MSRSFESTQITLDVVMQYDILPAEDDLLPLQIDIQAVYVTLATPNPEKFRRVNVLNALSESEIINLEDEILTRIGEIS
jgi:hypothetical protein